MPKRTDINSILIIGAGPIVIGQALRIRLSPAPRPARRCVKRVTGHSGHLNPATIMTDPEHGRCDLHRADHWQMVEKIIAKERPDAILPTMGGQTALNCALDLWRNGVLDKYKVELIGATRKQSTRPKTAVNSKRRWPRSVCRARNRLLPIPWSRRWLASWKSVPTLDSPVFHHGRLAAAVFAYKGRFAGICERGFEASPTHELLIGSRCWAGKVRDGSGARPRRQLHHRLLDRKPTPWVCIPATRSRWPGTDADRQGISDHA